MFTCFFLCVLGGVGLTGEAAVGEGRDEVAGRKARHACGRRYANGGGEAGGGGAGERPGGGGTCVWLGEEARGMGHGDHTGHPHGARSVQCGRHACVFPRKGPCPSLGPAWPGPRLTLAHRHHHACRLEARVKGQLGSCLGPAGVVPAGGWQLAVDGRLPCCQAGGPGPEPGRGRGLVEPRRRVEWGGGCVIRPREGGGMVASRRCESSCCR